MSASLLIDGLAWNRSRTIDFDQSKGKVGLDADYQGAEHWSSQT